MSETVSPAAGESKGSEPEASVEFPVELRAEIRRFARALPGMNYYEVLGITREARESHIREAFFERSKRFHPDRYFGQALGPYGGLLTEIYKRVVAAHDVLRDSHLRQDYDRRLSPQRGGPPPEGPSLRSRSGLRSRGAILRRLELQIEDGREKSRRQYQDALRERKRGSWVRAVSLLRLAMAFDPREQSYHEALAEWLPEANAAQVTELRDTAETLLARGDAPGALAYFEEASRLAPTDAELARQVAQLACDAGDLELACEFGERAASLGEGIPGPHKTLGRIYKALGRHAEARKEFSLAWQLDPTDEETKRELVER